MWRIPPRKTILNYGNHRQGRGAHSEKESGFKDFDLQEKVHVVEGLCDVIFGKTLDQGDLT